MNDNYCDDSASDQEDLVGVSASDLDDDITDLDEMQFSFCKGNLQTSNDTNNILDSSYNNNNNNNKQQQHLQHQQQQQQNKSKLSLFSVGFGLLITSFLLLITFPLYYQQLTLGGEEYNAFGGILYISLMTTIVLIFFSFISGIISKTNIKFYQFPLPPKRLFTISTCCGIAGTLCTISTFRRVPCHLQDPLKGAALVYSLIFYFFFCRKVMGLQRIFSATTAVVGLFISVDYGLCDEFRCRGVDTTSNTTTSVGWQGRAVWTLFYVIGIALWTLHLSLLEGHVITLNGPITHNIPPINLLSTVSRIVSNSEPLLSETHASTQPKVKPKSLHLATWVQGISFIVIFFLGWIDLIPGSGQMKPLSQFWSNTGNSFLCHFNIQHEIPDIKSHHETLEFLSNLTPYSILFNRTVQSLRNKRDNGKIKYLHKRINTKKFNNNNNNKNGGDDDDITNDMTMVHDITTNITQIKQNLKNLNKTLLINNSNNNNNSNSSNVNNYNINISDNMNNTLNNNNITTTQIKKVNTEKHIKKNKNHTNKNKHKLNTIINNNLNVNNNLNNKQTPVKISHLILKTNKTGDCTKVRTFSWLFICSYIGFILFLFEFLIITESAVFTIVVVVTSLPLLGIFWSVFELTTRGRSATLILSMEITGELICSLLGIPIILLGIVFLCRAHFTETTSLRTRSRGFYSSLTSRIA